MSKHRDMARPVLCIMPDGSRHVAGPPLTPRERVKAVLLGLFLAALLIAALFATTFAPVPQ